MRYKTFALALAGCLTILLGFSSSSFAASDNAKIANLKFSGPVTEADQKYLGLKSPGNFSLQDIQAPYVLIEITRTT
ncbi:MAG: hypothetical protein ACYC6G_02210 [Desulfobaccales bacterium]